MCNPNEVGRRYVQSKLRLSFRAKILTRQTTVRVAEKAIARRRSSQAIESILFFVFDRVNGQKKRSKREEIIGFYNILLWIQTSSLLILPLIGNIAPVTFSFFRAYPNIPIIRIIRLRTLLITQCSHLHHNWQL